MVGWIVTRVLKGRYGLPHDLIEAPPSLIAQHHLEVSGQPELDPGFLLDLYQRVETDVQFQVPSGPLTPPLEPRDTEPDHYRMASYTRRLLMLELLNCPCTGASLDRLIQPAILVVLAEGPLHGYRVAERIGQLPGFAGHKPDVSGIYRFLKSMEHKGLVVAAWDLSESGPAKKCYQLTPQGEQCLLQWVKTLQDYRQGITELLRAAPRRPPSRCAA